MFNKLKSVLRIGQSKAKGIIWQDGQRPSCEAGGSYLPCGNTLSYDNAFPDIGRIAEAFAEVMPYAVDEKGRRLTEQPPIIRALYNPNKEMSVSDFLETLITMLLVHPLVHILVWHYENGELVPGGPITPDNIAGFTFLEDVSVSRYAGKTTFMLHDRTYTRNDVISMSLNVNPYQLMSGFSPTQAIKKWATVDDYIAEYQAAQFGNGGVPAGLMTITAQSVEAYNEAVDRIIAAHTGPSNANRVIYTHRPTSTIDGKPMAAGVEWTPFAQSNKEMTLDSLFDQANKKIDMNFGVPEEVKGYLQNSNYASAEVADYVFARRILYPKLVKVYSKFTHEMNRVTGGLGCAVFFDYELPTLTDTRKVQVDALIEIINAGFTVESAVEALQLPRSYLKLVAQTKLSEDNLQVVDDAAERPSQAETSKNIHDCTHNHCHYQKAAEDLAEDIDPTLRELMGLYTQIILNEVSASSLDEAEVRLYDSKAAEVVRTLIIATILYLLLISETKAAKDFASHLGIETIPSALNNDELEEFGKQIKKAAAEAERIVKAGESIEGLDLADIRTTIEKITDSLVSNGVHAGITDFAEGSNYEKQLDYLLQKFATNELSDWKKATAGAANTAATVVIIQQLLAEKQYNDWRWALTEQHRGEELGKLLAAKEAGAATNTVPYKVWRARDGACESCLAMVGEKVRADFPFSNGNMVPSDHPNCRCYFVVEFLPEAKSVKVTCPHCKRYMFESSGGAVKNVICANSKCKRHYDIKVENGKIIAKERSVE